MKLSLKLILVSAACFLSNIWALKGDSCSEPPPPPSVVCCKSLLNTDIDNDLKKELQAQFKDADDRIKQEQQKAIEAKKKQFVEVLKRKQLEAHRQAKQEQLKKQQAAETVKATPSSEGTGVCSDGKKVKQDIGHLIDKISSISCGCRMDTAQNGGASIDSKMGD